MDSWRPPGFRMVGLLEAHRFFIIVFLEAPDFHMVGFLEVSRFPYG